MIPTKFRRGGEAILGTYDFFSTIGGVGYVTLYTCGGRTEADTDEYFITMDSSIIADKENVSVLGNTDIDYDLLIGKPFRVKAGTAVMSWAQVSGAGQDCKVTWNIYHVDVDGTETSIGTVNGDEYTAAGAAEYVRRCAQITITAKAFKRGEKLRINAVTVGGAASGPYHDPSGATIGTITSNSFLKLPVELPT